MSIHSSNLFDLDYRALSIGFNPIPGGIVDFHCHLSGQRALALYQEAARLYGVTRYFSMSQMEEIDEVRDVLGESVQFIAFPRFRGVTDLLHELGPGYEPRIREFHRRGARIVKFWSAPRLFDMVPGDFARHPLRLDGVGRRAAIETAGELGMKIMVHVSDPDTWFAGKYRDIKHYGSKLEQYEPLEWLLQNYKLPVIAAHLGGSPENLPFLSSLLQRYPQLSLDTSAMKWMVRELSKHSKAERVAFFERWRGRIMFGSDIVVLEAHLRAGEKSFEIATKASTEAEAFDLYASRFWALRTLFETDWSGASPVADPDLKMVDPTCSDMASPALTGATLPPDLLQQLYRGAAESLMNPL